jgi:hypothetical protein
MARKRQSRDQKRKAKLEKRARKNPPRPSMAYTGDRYRSDDLLPVVQATEMGVCQAYVLSNRQITDHQVRTALEQLIGQIRADQLPEFEHACTTDYTPGHEVDLVVWGIRHNWHHLFEEEDHPGNDNLVGVLRTLLGSLDNFGTKAADSRGYLNFVEGFLAKEGITFDEGEEDPFYEAGLAWVEDDDDEARVEFLDTAEHLLARGEASEVVNVCNRLLGAAHGTPAFEQIGRLSHRAAEFRERRKEEG